MITEETRIIDLTVSELQIIISNSVKQNISQQANLMEQNEQKLFYSPMAFSKLTGIPYSTVVYRCNLGKLKARQDNPKCSWQIDASELERYKEESGKNTL